MMAIQLTSASEGPLNETGAQRAPAEYQTAQSAAEYDFYAAQNPQRARPSGDSRSFSNARSLI
jgi:hypothetical protein